MSNVDLQFRENVLSKICPICQRGPFESLAQHTSLKHGIYKDELRRRAGMNKTESISSERLRDRRIEQGKRTGELNFKDLTGRTFTNLTVKGFSGIVARRSHWRCLCSCGRETFVDGSKLLSGHTRSCGCIRRGMAQPWHRKEYGRSVRNRVVWQYRTNAKSRGVSFDLTDEEIDSLFASDCWYCGRPPSLTATRPKSYGEFTYNGIDRIDSFLGYTMGNVLPCCMECNYRKSAQPQQEFLLWVRRVAEHQGWIIP